MHSLWHLASQSGMRLPWSASLPFILVKVCSIYFPIRTVTCPVRGDCMSSGQGVWALPTTNGIAF
eukprot:3875125-Prorocentrum_lima.AAC.1